MTIYEHKREKTQNQIIAATIKLGKENGLNNLTISDIIRAANINRSTFYRHFIDKKDLIEAMENKVLERIKNEANLLDRNRYDNDNDHTAFVTSFLEMIDDNHTLIHFLVSNKGDIGFNYMLADLFFDLGQKRLSSIFYGINEHPKQLYTHYFGSALIGLIKFWLDNYDEYTKKEILNFILKIDIQHNLPKRDCDISP